MRYVYVHMSAGASEARGTGSLELKLKTVVTLLTCVPGFSARTVYSFNHWTISPVPKPLSDSQSGDRPSVFRLGWAPPESRCLQVSLLIPCPYDSIWDPLKFNSATTGDWEIMNWEWTGKVPPEDDILTLCPEAAVHYSCLLRPFLTFHWSDWQYGYFHNSPSRNFSSHFDMKKEMSGPHLSQIQF